MAIGGSAEGAEPPQDASIKTSANARIAGAPSRANLLGDRGNSEILAQRGKRRTITALPGCSGAWNGSPRGVSGRHGARLQSGRMLIPARTGAASVARNDLTSWYTRISVEAGMLG